MKGRARRTSATAAAAAAQQHPQQTPGRNALVQTRLNFGRRPVATLPQAAPDAAPPQPAMAASVVDPPQRQHTPDPQSQHERHEPEQPEQQDEQDEPPQNRSYIHQMQSIIDAVMSEEQHLFDDDQMACVAAYQSLSDQAKAVYFRLVNRRRVKYERVSKLKITSGPRHGQAVAVDADQDEDEKEDEDEDADDGEGEGEGDGMDGDECTDSDPSQHGQTLQADDAGIDMGMDTETTATSTDVDSDRMAVLAELESAGFVRLGGPDTLSDWLLIARRDEIVRLCRSHRIRTTGVKLPLLQSSLLASVATQRTLAASASRLHGFSSRADAHNQLLDAVKTQIGPVYRMEESARDTFQRLFVVALRCRVWPANSAFMTDSILSNLAADNNSGSRRSFVKVAVHRTALVWPTKHDFDAYFRVLKTENEVEALVEKLLSEGTTRVSEDELAEYCDRMRPLVDEWRDVVRSDPCHVTGIPWFMIFTHGYLLTRMVDQYARILSQCKKHDAAIQILDALLSQRVFRNAKRGSWYDELAKLLENYKSVPAAKAKCIEALSDTYVQSAHRSGIVRRLLRITGDKQAGIPALWHIEDRRAVPNTRIHAYKITNETGNKALYLNDQGTPIHVEQLGLEYFAKQGWKGLHSENSIVTTLFGVLFWDILFDDTVPGVFNSPFQSAPHDLYTEYFYEARKAKIEARIAEIQRNGHVDLIAAVVTREQPRNTQCVGVNWKRYSKDTLVEIADCIGGPGLARICGLYAKTYWAHMGGVPDLCLWKPNEKRFKLVEVKVRAFVCVSGLQPAVVRMVDAAWLERARETGCQRSRLCG
ncbi:hypothetical protein BC831DRAFT_464343 [Entophlyctis helioformis]|nr:hypothetical protein BC831DRAFT_464343 [Entophlyctis helioformis]